MKLIVAGSRDYQNKAVVFGALAYFLGDKKVEIVSGEAPGPDTFGIEYAERKGWNVHRFPYESQYGKAGGPIRNRKMAQFADALLAFWDGKSKGTKNMIEQAKARNLSVRVVRTDEDTMKYENLWYAIDVLNLETI